jgi:hypothetical protein
MKQQKTYFAWINDHSGSMQDIAQAALKDFNANIEAVVQATSDKKLDAIVSVIRLGIGDSGRGVERTIVNSNPHVLKPMEDWPTPGGTPLYDAIGNAIELGESLPDAKEDHVSFLITITTDGDELHSQKYNGFTIKKRIKEMQDTGRWTFVFRVPASCVDAVKDLGVPLDNIQAWDVSEKGMAQSTAATAAAIDSYVTTRASGKKATGGFFANATNVNLAQLDDVSAQYKLYVVPDVDADDGMMISAFMLRHRMQYLKGAAFYQLVKTESKVGPDKAILIQERTTGKVYGGQQARDMLGIPRGQNARLHPGQLTGYNVFIQSTSWNRKLPKGTGVLYNDKLGVPFTQEELDRFTLPAAPKVVPSAPVSAMLPEVNNTSGKPVKSTMPITQPLQPVFYNTRDDARRDKQMNGADYIDLGSDKPKGQRFQQTKRPSHKQTA